MKLVIMQQLPDKIELLAPAGNLEKLEIAINYGADAVYLSGENFSLRNFSDNFSLEKMRIARNITLKNNVKMYIAVNIYSRNREETAIDTYLKSIRLIKPDAIIVADPSIFVKAKELIPDIPVHISTQANTTNTRTAIFWEKLGAKRVNVARELSMEEIKEIACSSKIEVEAFVHGSMCIAYSGRCLMSNFMSQRGSNQGMCCQPCRFNYTVMEKKQPGEYYPVYEDKHGSYIFNSKDLCMIDYISDLIKTGIKSLKIEGRMKGINYVATTTKIYREAIDMHYSKNKDNYNILSKNWHDSLNRISNRGYCTGFFLNDPKQTTSNLDKEITSTHIFIAKVLAPTKLGKTSVNVRNKLFVGDKVKIMSPLFPSEINDQITEITDTNKTKLDFAQPGSNVNIQLNSNCEPMDLIQKIKT